MKLPLCDDEDNVSSLIKQNTRGNATAVQTQCFWYNALIDYVAEQAISIADDADDICKIIDSLNCDLIRVHGSDAVSKARVIMSA